MPASLTMTAFDAFLKEFYPQHEIEFLASMSSPWFNKVKKKRFYGDAYVVPTDWAFPAGGAHTFAKAQANRSAAERSKFTVTTVDFYQEISIDAKVLATTTSDLGSFADGRKREVDAGMKGVGKKLARATWRDRGCTLGQLDSDPGTGTTFVFKNYSDANFISKNEVILAHSASTGGSVRAGGTRTVTAINRKTATITVGAAIDAAWAINDYIDIEGDYDTGPAGVLDWIPASDPSSATLYGVDRTQDNEALSGWRVGAAANPTWDNILVAAERVNESGGDASTTECFLHTRQYSQLVKEIHGKLHYTDNSDATIGKSSIKVASSMGPLTVTADPFCTQTQGYVMDMSTWEVIYNGDGLPHMVDDDGQIAVRSATADTILIRMRGYYNVVCWAPIRNATFPLTAVN